MLGTQNIKTKQNGYNLYPHKVYNRMRELSQIIRRSVPVIMGKCSDGLEEPRKLSKRDFQKLRLSGSYSESSK